MAHTRLQTLVMAEKGQDFEWMLNVVGRLSFEKVSGSITLRRKQKIADRFSGDREKWILHPQHKLPVFDQQSARLNRAKKS